MLEAIPSNFFATNFQLQQDNQLLGEVDTGFWGEKARLELEDGTYELYREGMFSGDFVLERNGEVVARAAKPSVLQNRFEVQLPDRRLVLRKPSAWSWSRRFVLSDGEKQIGSIDPVGFFTRRTIIDLPDNWSLPIRVFLFWLAVIIWKRQSYAAAS